MYVPYYSDCKTLDCGPHTYPSRGRCLMKERLVADPGLQPFPNGTTRFSITVTLRPPVLTDHTGLSDAAGDLERAYKSFLESESNLTGTGISFDMSEFRVSVVDSLIVKPLKQKQLTLKRQGSVHFVLSLKVDVVVLGGSLYDVVVLSVRLAKKKPADFAAGGEFVPQTVVVSNMLGVPKDWQCPNGTMKHLRNPTLKIDDAHAYFLQTPTTFYSLENIGFELQTFPADNTSTPALLHAAVLCGPSLAPIACHHKGYVHLNASIFTVTNDSLVVQLNGDTFNKSQFRVFYNGSAVVCNIYNSTYTKNVRTLVLLTDYVIQTVARATYSVSMAGLVVVLVTYSLLPQLRNVPGVIVMSYSGSLLVHMAVAMLMEVPEGWLCDLVACLYHVSMLSTLLWKCALSFDLVFMLRLKSIKNSSHAARARMLNRYCVVCWLLPAVFVLGFWLLDFFHVFTVGYGSRDLGACWFGTAWAQLYLAVLPLGTAWLFNFVCLAMSLRLIYQSGRLVQGGEAARPRMGNSHRAADRRRLLAYARISLLMGLSWVLTFVAAAVNLKELWVAAILLDGSQGVHLLLCFVLKRRVWAMLKERLGGGREQQGGGGGGGDGDAGGAATTTTSASNTTIASTAATTTHGEESSPNFPRIFAKGQSSPVSRPC